MTYQYLFLHGFLALGLFHLTKADSVDGGSGGQSPYVEEIQCYNLPYGALGFLSHLLTCYSLTMQCLGRPPLLPLGTLQQGKWNKSLMALKSIMTIIPCIYTMAHCSHDWQFQTIAAMKLALSLTAILIGLHPRKEWAILYVIASIPATIGTIFLAASYFNGAMETVVGVFAAVGFLITFGMLAWALRKYGRRPGPFFMAMLAAELGFMPILGAIWSDWVLAVIAENTVGFATRSDKASQALWVIYWIGKRLSLLVM